MLYWLGHYCELVLKIRLKKLHDLLTYQKLIEYRYQHKLLQSSIDELNHFTNLVINFEKELNHFSKYYQIIGRLNAKKLKYFIDEFGTANQNTVDNVNEKKRILQANTIVQQGLEYFRDNLM
jgi:hypothetical protein